MRQIQTKEEAKAYAKAAAVCVVVALIVMAGWLWLAGVGG